MIGKVAWPPETARPETFSPGLACAPELPLTANGTVERQGGQNWLGPEYGVDSGTVKLQVCWLVGPRMAVALLLSGTAVTAQEIARNSNSLMFAAPAAVFAPGLALYLVLGGASDDQSRRTHGLLVQP